jgi:hypothetical protein
MPLPTRPPGDRRGLGFAVALTLALTAIIALLFLMSRLG